MSFFEKMMRLNQVQDPQKWLEDDDDLPLSTHGDPEWKEGSKVVQSSRRVEQEMPEVPQEPKPQPVYVSVKPVLMSCLLPKRQQLLRDMLAKKREFELKKMTNSNMTKGVELKQRLNQSSFKFANASQMQPKPAEPVKHSDNSNPTVHPLSNKKHNSSHPNSNSKQPKKSLKESLVLDISESSTQKQSLSSNAVEPITADPFNRQIMLRLLNMLENQRNDRKDFMAMSMSNHYQYHPHEREKEAPIVINNILKTPVDALNRDLIEREMKIRMLENNRSKHKNSFNFALNAPLTEQKIDNPLTQRSEAPKCNQFNGTTNPQHYKDKPSLDCSRISIHSKRDEQLAPFKVQEKSTKPSSNFSSQIQEDEAPSKPKKRERSFNRNKTTKNEDKPIQAESQSPSNQKGPDIQNQSNKVSQVIVHKASIRLDIPLSQGSETQGLTLAEAFKKRIGKLKSEKEKSEKESIKQTAKSKNPTVVSDQNFIKTQLYPQFTPKESYLPLFPLESSQTVNLNKAKVKKAQPKNASVVLKEQESSSCKSREPSKELIDRLIGGERAKVSKKEMYALTRKNYENLPQIQAKKQEEEKKRLQRQRLAKIRQMQRSTRSLKQVKMTLQ